MTSRVARLRSLWVHIKRHWRIVPLVIRATIVNILHRLRNAWHWRRIKHRLFKDLYNNNYNSLVQCKTYTNENLHFSIFFILILKRSMQILVWISHKIVRVILRKTLRWWVPRIALRGKIRSVRIKVWWFRALIWWFRRRTCIIGTKVWRTWIYHRVLKMMKTSFKFIKIRINFILVKQKLVLCCIWWRAKLILWRQMRRIWSDLCRGRNRLNFIFIRCFYYEIQF